MGLHSHEFGHVHAFFVQPGAGNTTLVQVQHAEGRETTFTLAEAAELVGVLRGLIDKHAASPV